MEFEVKHALDELLKLELSAEAQQMIVNLVSALAKSGCNMTPTRKSMSLSILSGSPTSPGAEKRVEEPGVDWKPVPCSPSLGTPKPERIRPPVEGLRRKLLCSPEGPDDAAPPPSETGLKEAWLELGLAAEQEPGQADEARLQQAWAELDLVIDEAHKAYCEYRARLSRAFQAYEQFCASFMSRDAIELSKKWRDFVMEQRRVTSDFDEYSQRKQRLASDSPERRSSPHYGDMEAVIKQVYDRGTRAQKLEEIQRDREMKRLRRQAEIAQAARDMCLWSEEAQRAKKHVEEVSRKCEEVRSAFKAFAKKVPEIKQMPPPVA